MDARTDTIAPEVLATRRSLDALTLRSARARYVLFFSTYLYQGLVAGFSLTALANHYAGLGIPASEVGLHFAVIGLPWTVQPILWGPLIDRARGAAMGRRRAIAVAAILACQACLAALLLVPGPPAMAWIGLSLFGHSVFASLLDTACDRLVMDHVPEAQLGRASGCTRGGFVTGTSLGAGVFAWLLADDAFATAVAVLLAASTLAALPVLLIREAPEDAILSWRRRQNGTADRAVLPFETFLKRLALGLRRPAALRLLALCFGLDFVLSLFEVRFGVDLVQVHGWDAATLSRLQAELALAGGTLGALAIGLWSDRAGALAALTGLFATSAIAFALTGGLFAAGLVGPAGPAILGFTNVLPNLVVVALVPALIQASRGRAGAATRFEVYMAVMNLGSVCGAALSGPLALMPPGLVAGLVACVFLAGAALSRRPALILGKSATRKR